MTRRSSARTIGAMFAIVVAVTSVTPNAGATRSNPDDSVAVDTVFVAGQVLVRFHPGIASARRSRALATVHGSVVRTLPEIGYSVVQIPLAADVPATVARLRADDAVDFAEPNVTGKVAIAPDDRCLDGGCDTARQWDVAAVNAPRGWDVVPGRFYTAQEKKLLPPVRVAVLDTKIDISMPDWGNATSEPLNRPYDTTDGGQLNTALGRDFIDLAQQEGTAAYHGTFVAGILGASANNGTDIAGFAYRAEIVPITIVDGNGATTGALLAQAILYAHSVGARVINLSLGISGPSDAVERAINSVSSPLDDSPGSLVVAAAGNNANNQPFYPSYYPKAMAVSAVDEADRPGSCTNHNSRVSVAAPGAGIVSLDPRSPSRVSVVGCGTSTATPHVSALAALLFAQNPARTPTDVRHVIENNADDDRFRPGRDDYFGRGRINFERALRDGDGPSVNQVKASFPRNIGGFSQIQAIADATSTTTIAGAEAWIDTVGTPGTGTALSATDGAFDSGNESLSGEVNAPLEISAGVHHLYVRAYDGTTWGATSVGVLIVDRLGPTITNLKGEASNTLPPQPSSAPTPPSYGVAAASPARFSFSVADDYSPDVTWQFSVVRQVVPGNQVVYTSASTLVSSPSTVAGSWQPAATDHGPYQIIVTATDEATNQSRAVLGTFVL